MKTIFEYNESTGELKDSNGDTFFLTGLVGFEPEPEKSIVLDLIKQGVTPEEIIKLKHNDLI